MNKGNEKKSLFTLFCSKFFIVVGKMSNDSLKNELIEEKSVSISNKYHCQTGILTPFEVNEHGLYIIGKE